MAEAVPARGAHFAVSPLRHDVMVPQQDTIERVDGGFEIGAVLGEDHLLDHGVNGWILDADHVQRAGLVRRLRTPIAALFVARRQRFAPGECDDVEIPIAQPIFVLRFVDRAHRDGDAQTLDKNTRSKLGSAASNSTEKGSPVLVLTSC